MSDADGVGSNCPSWVTEDGARTASSGAAEDEQGRETLAVPGEDGETVAGWHKLGDIQEQQETLQVYTATPRTLFPLQECRSPRKTHPLTLRWAFGMNKTLPVFSLQDKERLVTFYACAHVAVMCDHTSASQHLLQGHCSPVSCLCASEDRRWLVTADKGPDSLVIIWDSYSGIPVRTLFDSHPEGGVAQVAMSKDSKLLVTVGSRDIQRVCIWDWTTETETPLCVKEVGPEYGRQQHILFHPTDSNQLLSNSESRVLFHTKDKARLEFSAPKISDKTFRKAVGPFSQSIFHPGGVQAVTATLTGNVLVWDIPHHAASPGLPPRKATKLIQLEMHGISVLTQIDSFIVTGDVQGHVTVYDEHFKQVERFSQFGLGPVASISFSREEDRSGGGLSELHSESKPFIRRFVLSTADTIMLHVDPQAGPPQMLLRGHSEAVHAVACHPCQPVIATGSHCGLLRIWNYQQKELVYCRVIQEKRLIQCLAYDAQGVCLALGFTCGAVEIMDTSASQDDESHLLKCSSHCISHVAFSLDSQYLATADTGNTVTVIRLHFESGRKVWRYLGRHRSHYKPIQDLLFGVQLDSNQPRLFSLGMDRMLVEYDILGSREDDLRICSVERIEQGAVPTCMTWYPPLTSEHFLLTASDHFKMKLFNSTTKMCRKTLLGPTYGSPVKKIASLPAPAGESQKSHYLVFINEDKVGLQILPLDGNPHKSFAMLCHPTGASSFTCSYDGKYIFTTGGVDCTLLSWETNLNALEAVASLGGQGIEPFYGLLEGGRDGEFYKEMEDYFYHCQLRSQAVDTVQPRQLSTAIPLAEVPFMMRALGFFPTEQELQDMHNEVRFSRYAETGKYVTDVGLEEFIKLYVNHRPAFEAYMPEMERLFELLGCPNDKGEQCLNREELLDVLQARGEHMTEEELAESFITLLGLNTGGGSCQDIGTEALVEHTVPVEITEATLIGDILGFSHPRREPVCSRREQPLTGAPISRPEV
ncbi:cilia- and flagella-associated protein 251 isoform X1 [Brienomyrus brachyistius]|uniref:cilia- and flagella-associated protein 251 isoform X1 n=1 Tax=Brienomyrus brachyistius TaxID=42636 RepID=UPI0020B2D1CD|nr:cilia- and flagella-associated protein 251 isoform X1 [Brienomyrus brachyistius]XP_048833992.1 cilia- and flagella-associated protein 251 isoform X1 [Brienomyrus brachyistius]